MMGIASGSSALWRTVRLAIGIGALTIAACAQAAPVMLSTTPGVSSYTFPVAATHQISDPNTGLFGDVFSFSLASTLATTTTAVYFNGDIENFSARLYQGLVTNASTTAGFNLVATGISHGVGGTDPLQNPISYNNAIILGSLTAGTYSLVITGNDLAGGDPAPYSLQVSVGPVIRASSVPEPVTQWLVALAAGVLLLSTRGCGNCASHQIG